MLKCYDFVVQHPDGLPLRDLREELIDEGVTDAISDDRLQELLSKADKDGDALVTYREFMRMVQSFFFRF